MVLPVACLRLCDAQIVGVGLLLIALGLLVGIGGFLTVAFLHHVSQVLDGVLQEFRALGQVLYGLFHLRLIAVQSEKVINAEPPGNAAEQSLHDVAHVLDDIDDDFGKFLHHLVYRVGHLVKQVVDKAFRVIAQRVKYLEYGTDDAAYLATQFPQRLADTVRAFGERGDELGDAVGKAVQRAVRHLVQVAGEVFDALCRRVGVVGEGFPCLVAGLLRLVLRCCRRIDLALRYVHRFLRDFL